MRAPKVSVVMPAYNAERYLEEAVTSVLGQTLGDLELIVVDDGSTDSTTDILAHFAREDTRVRPFRREHAGIVAAVTYGTQVARSSLIARMDADDIALPHRLEYQLGVLDRRPDVGALGTWLRYIGPNGDPRGEWRTPVGSALVAWSLHFGTALANPTVMLRRQIYKRVGGDRQEYRFAHDYDLWLRLARQTELDNVPEFLLTRRVHPTSDSHLYRDNYEEKVLELVLAAIRETVGTKPPLELISAIRRAQASPRTVDSATIAAAARGTWWLFERYREAADLTPEDARVVRLDTVRRLRDLSRLARSRDTALSHRLLLQSWRLRLPSIARA